MNNDLHLSKLSRGKGERVGQNIQVVYDDQDLAERFYADFYSTSENKLRRAKQQVLFGNEYFNEPLFF